MNPVEETEEDAASSNPYYSRRQMVRKPEKTL